MLKDYIATLLMTLCRISFYFKYSQRQTWSSTHIVEPTLHSHLESNLFCEPKFNQLRPMMRVLSIQMTVLKAGRKLVYNGWSPTLLRAEVSWFGIPFCWAVNVSSIAVLYWLAFSISWYGRIPPPSLPAFAPLVLACQPAVSGSDEVKTWWYTGTTGIINKWRQLLECGKDGQSKRRPSTFQQRHIALFVFDSSLGHACKAKKPWLGTGWIFSQVKSTCNAQHGIRMELNRG